MAEITPLPDPEAAWKDARPHLKPYALHELGQLPRREYLVKGYLDKGGLSVLFGESNSGKSFFALDRALHIALGWEWRGRRVKQGAVVYVASEGGLGLVERLTAFRYHYDIDPEIWADTPFYLITDRADFFGSPGDADTILRHVQDLEIKPCLYEIDTLAATSGAGNENAAADMNQYLTNAGILRRDGAAVGIVHHSGKDAAKGARGSSVVKAADDTESEVVADADGNRTTTISKQRDGPTGDEFHFTLQSVEIGMDEDGDRITSCVVIAADTGPGRNRSKRKALAPKTAKVLAVLNDCIVDGQTSPGPPHYPPGVRLASADHWRDEVVKRRVYDTDNKDSAERLWRRARTELTGKERIAERAGLVWIVKGA